MKKTIKLHLQNSKNSKKKTFLNILEVNLKKKKRHEKFAKSAEISTENVFQDDVRGRKWDVCGRNSKTKSNPSQPVKTFFFLKYCVCGGGGSPLSNPYFRAKPKLSVF